MSLIARLGVLLGLDNKEFIAGIDQATNKTREFEMNQKRALRNAQKAQDEFIALAGKGLLGIAAAGVAVGQAFKYADQIEDTAAAYDVTTSSLLAMQAAMQGAGGEAENIGTALNKLASIQQDAIEGSDELRKAFTELKISGKDVENLNLEDLFKRVFQELAKIEDAGKRAALQNQILGKSMKGVDAATFVNKYKEMADPNLLFAIQENAKAWDNIELAFKNILYFAQKLVSPLAAIVNSIADIADTMKNIQEGGSTEIDWGAAESGMGGYYAPGSAITHGYGASPQRQKKAIDIAKAAQEGNFSKESTKDEAARKKREEDQRRAKEAQIGLREEIKLIERKIELAEKNYALDAKAITLGKESIAQEKLRLQLEEDIATIKKNAAKERAKDNAQIDLINQKEEKEIELRNAEYTNATNLIAKQAQRNHQIKIQQLSDEGHIAKFNHETEVRNFIRINELEKKQNELGYAAYEYKKLEVEKLNEQANIRLKYLQQSQAINAEYEASGKSIRDTELYEEKILNLKNATRDAIEGANAKETDKKDLLLIQMDYQKKMFDLDLAKQKGMSINNIQQGLKIDKERLDLERQRYLMSTNQYNLSSLALDNVQRLAEAEKKYADQIKEAEYLLQQQGNTAQAREQYEARIKMIEEVRDVEINAIKQVNDARQKNLDAEIERQHSFSEGWEASARKFAEDSENAFARGGQAFASVMGSLDQAISTFVQTGKFKFEDFALSVIRNMIAIEAQAKATSIFKSIVSFLLPSPAAPVSSGGPIMGGGNVGFHAAGGGIIGPSIVGENGPELFVPNMPGTIIPNGSWQQAAASMGGNGFVNNGTYIANMSAIDTQSGQQFLAANKNTIWAAYQSANRSVPISR